MERSLAFYRDLLGLEIVGDQRVGTEFASRVTGVAGAQLRIVFLQLEPHGHLLELIEYESCQGAAAPPGPGSAHVCFVVDDLDAAYQRLRACGARFVSAPVPIGHGPNAGGKTVYLRDPDFVTVELFQPPEDGTPLLK